MSSVVNWLGDIFKGISSIGSTIIDGISGFFRTIIDYLNPFSDNFILKVLFDWISDLLKEIFVPDTNKLKSDFNAMLSSISDSFGISFDSISEFSNTWSEKPVENINANYNIHGVGTLNLKFFDATYLINGVERFRPVIRGFVVFLLILYNYYQVLTFIGQDPRIAINAERTAEAHLSRKENGR